MHLTTRISGRMHTRQVDRLLQDRYFGILNMAMRLSPKFIV